jgi:hypothetical protein
VGQDSQTKMIPDEAGQQSRGILIAEMAPTGANPLLQGQGVGAVFQQLQIVIELKDKPIACSQPGADQMGNLAGVGTIPKASLAITYHISHRIGCIMGYAIRSNLQIPDLQQIARLKLLKATHFAYLFFSS